ncbi:MAG: hypothetical protein HY788_13175 [Deltaproteobacteria bacterium]|nr:hypothetical protein [Deltaproteobacteria bacterium]
MATEKPKQKSEITFKYVYQNDYKPVYVNGVYGGTSPRGEIELNFFHERRDLANEITHDLDSSGRLGKVIRTDPKNLNATMVRFISTGVVMSVESARELNVWLQQKIEEAENLKTILQQASSQERI